MHALEERRQRPFWRMVQLFVDRIFRGGGDSDSEGLDLGVGLVLTLLAMPGGFVSLLLARTSTGRSCSGCGAQPDSIRCWSLLPDEYFFIVLSMTVTGAVAVWRWDAIFPDRRDYMNLVPLPISTRTIFFANLVAVLFLVGLIAVDVNAASCDPLPPGGGRDAKRVLVFLTVRGGARRWGWCYPACSRSSPYSQCWAWGWHCCRPAHSRTSLRIFARWL